MMIELRSRFFKKGLNQELQKAITYQLTMPTVFSEYVQACIKLDNNIRADKALHPRIFTNSRAPPATTSAPPATQTTATGTAPGPMDLSHGRTTGISQKRGPLTEAQRKYRRDNGLCMYCGQQGHWAPDCPLRQKYQNRPQINAAAASESANPAASTNASSLYETKN
jgi:hypothetical protein